MNDYPLDCDDCFQLLDDSRSQFERELTDFRNTVEIIEQHFSTAIREFTEEAQEIRKKIEDYEQKHGPIKNFEDSAWWTHLSGLYAYSRDCEETYPCHVRAGLFLTLYGIIEKEPYSLGNVWALQSSLSPRDLRGTGIQRSATFFLKVMGISVPDSILHGPKYRLINLIRNSIAHNQGFLTREGENDTEKRFLHLRHECMLEKAVTTDKLGCIKLQSDFLRWFIDQTQSTLDCLIAELKQYVSKYYESR